MRVDKKNNWYYNVASNESKLTFTIRSQKNGKTIFKYRTITFTPDEFYEMCYNTQEDWHQFLKTDEYYLIKTYYNNL